MENQNHRLQDWKKKSKRERFVLETINGRTQELLLKKRQKLFRLCLCVHALRKNAVKNQIGFYEQFFKKILRTGFLPLGYKEEKGLRQPLPKKNSFENHLEIEIKSMF